MKKSPKNRQCFNVKMPRKISENRSSNSFKGFLGLAFIMRLLIEVQATLTFTSESKHPHVRIFSWCHTILSCYVSQLCHFLRVKNYIFATVFESVFLCGTAVLTQFIGVMITLKFMTWVDSNSFKLEWDLSFWLLNISVRLSAGFGL